MISAAVPRGSSVMPAPAQSHGLLLAPSTPLWQDGAFQGKRIRSRIVSVSPSCQPGFLAPLPPHARYLTLNLASDAEPTPALKALAAACDGNNTVVGIGATLVQAMNAKIDGLRRFPCIPDATVAIPSTPAALWLWLRGSDRGELLHRSRALCRTLSPAFVLDQAVDAFVYGNGLDLSGYEDGTENPKGDDAMAAAVMTEGGPGMAGSSMVAVQQWRHNLDHWATFEAPQQDHIIGRRRADNEEIDDAPKSAHVKRTAQESYDPPAFMLRRSMPFAEQTGGGLMFVAFGRSFDAFEAVLRRMAGIEDGTTDALFRFTRPVTGSYFWCPPVMGESLDLRALL